VRSRVRAVPPLRRLPLPLLTTSGRPCCVCCADAELRQRLFEARRKAFQGSYRGVAQPPGGEQREERGTDDTGGGSAAAAARAPDAAAAP
jgi:hypothetical protein